MAHSSGQRPEQKRNNPRPFKPVSSRVSFPKMEEAILSFWKERDVFRQSVRQREGAPRFTLFEGPPTANGSPGIHHVLSRVFKDLFPRYKTMRGYQSPRKGGWDTHGLPVELEVERQLKLASKPDIEAFGVEEFNRRCRESVFRYVKEWETMTERVGFWVDLEHAYVTYDNDYIETGWWIIKQLWDHGLVYQGRRVAPHCPRCGTTLSSHEVAQGYRENTPDPSIYVKFEVDFPGSFSLWEDLNDSPGVVPDHAVPARVKRHGTNVHLLAWTTTPWTLPGNVALAVAADDAYVLVRLEEIGELLILAEALVADVMKKRYEVLERFKGSELASFRYRPLYDPYEAGLSKEYLRFFRDGQFTYDADVLPDGSVAEQPSRRMAENSWRVVAADFVTMADGTGIVHIAPAFGEDDYKLGLANGLLFVQPVTLAGEFVDGYPWSGKFVKNADAAIIEDLKARGLLYRRETLKHTYPFCWRCDTPLLYYAKSSWYLKTTEVRDRLLAANQEINWFPEHIKDGRFGEWLRGNVDWAISRERFWGTPWPVWQCEGCGHQDAIGSKAELADKPGVQGMTADLDLHRPYVDRVTFDCPACGATMRRLPDVIDGWFDSGAMPLAQWHYPFENRELVEGGGWYPADFICEAVDQTRGWFYSLHAVATLLEAATDGSIRAPSYKNVISLGHILDAKGEKMSKSRGNVVDPWEVLNAHGADALRWYLYSATPPGNSRRFSTDLVAEAVRSFLLTLWNTYSFFVTYANIDGWTPDGAADSPPTAELDRWVLSRLHTLTQEVTELLDAYDPTTSARRIQAFVDDLSNWYVRRSRRRFWKSENDEDKASAYRTLYECLTTLSKLLAPFTPFVAEEMYRNLVGSVDPTAPESVHLTDYPEAASDKIDATLSREVDFVIKIVSMGRAARSKAKLRVRQPLQRVVLATADGRDAIERLADHVREELNVKEVAFVGEQSDLVTYQVKGNPATLGPKYGKEMGKVMGAIAKTDPGLLAAAARKGTSVEVEGFLLEARDLDVRIEGKPGYAVASDNALTVAVTTEVTPELAQEGMARELVHHIQNMRRSAGFDITDRIVTYYEAGDELAKVFEAQGDYIRQETLSLSLECAPAPNDAFAESLTLEDRQVTLAVKRAG